MGVGPHATLYQLDGSGDPKPVGPDNPLYISGGGGSGGGGSKPFTEVQTTLGGSYQILPNENVYLRGTTGGTFTLAMPENPSPGDTLTVVRPLQLSTGTLLFTAVAPITVENVSSLNFGGRLSADKNSITFIYNNVNQNWTIESSRLGGSGASQILQTLVSGLPSTLTASTTATEGTVPIYTSGGVLLAANPSGDTNVATKQYVDWQRSIRTANASSATLTSSTEGRTLSCTNIAPITITVPQGLLQGYSVRIVQTTAGGTVTVVGSGATVLHGDKLATDSQWDILELRQVSSNQWVVTNPTATSGQVLSSVAGYDAGQTQTLKNVSGVFTWVTD